MVASLLLLLLVTVATATCGPGQVYDAAIVRGCVPLFPTPLAFVGAIMDARYTACDESFERMMCGSVDEPRALRYAELRYHKQTVAALEQRASPWWKACMGRPVRSEATIEYKHMVERMLGDIYVAADLPAAWGRLNRAGYAEAAGAPFALHRRAAQWYLSVPGALLDRAHGLGEGQLYQLLQAGPVAYNVVELQQRIGYLVETAQVLQHHRSGNNIGPVVVRFSDLSQRWPWALYLGGVSPPEPDEMIIADDLPYLEWILESSSVLTVHHWRAWLEFHLAQAHRGHVAVSSPDACINMTFAMVPEIAHSSLIASSSLGDWSKIEAEVQHLGNFLLGGVRVLSQRACPVEASMSPDRFDHNVNLVRAWRWAQEQTASSPADDSVFDVTWPLLQHPLYNPAYGQVSKYAIFGTALLYQHNHHNLTAALAQLIKRVWPLLPLTADRQHLFMVFAQAFCGEGVDDALRATPEFSEVFGCHEGQAMWK